MTVSRRNNVTASGTGPATMLCMGSAAIRTGGDCSRWSSNMAPSIMGASAQSELAVELTNSFCRTDPEIAKSAASVTFLTDLRSALPKLRSPSLIVQCDDDLIAPVAVGEYMRRVIPRSTLSVIANIGHCPHLSSPSACSATIDAFLVK